MPTLPDHVLKKIERTKEEEPEYVVFCWRESYREKGLDFESFFDELMQELPFYEPVSLNEVEKGLGDRQSVSGVCLLLKRRSY